MTNNTLGPKKQIPCADGSPTCESFDRQTPISLLVRTRVYESDRQRALEAGANFVLRKPCECDGVPTIVCQLINEFQQLQLISSKRLCAFRTCRSM